jgi:hypothetical protein
LFDEPFGPHGAMILLEGLVMLESVSDRSLQALTRNAPAPDPSEFAVLRAIRVVPVEAMRGKVLEYVTFDLHVVFLQADG